MKKLVKKLASLLMIISLLGVIITGCSKAAQNTQGNNNDIEGNDIEKQIQKKDTIEIFGTVEALDKKFVTLEFPVKINEIIVSEGQQASLNDSIVELDLLGQDEKYNTLSNQIKNIEDQIVKQQTIIDSLNKDIETKDKGLKNRSLPEIQAKQLSYDIANTAYEQAKIDLAESEIQYQAGTMSQDTFNREKQALYNLEKNVSLEKLSIDLCIALIENQLDGLQKELIQNEKILSDLQNVQLVESTMELNNISKQLFDNVDLKDSFIVSGFNESIIEKVYCEEGQVINSGSPIVSIIDKSSIYIKGEVPEEFIGFVKEGSSVRVIPVYDKTRSYEGTIDKISQVGTNKNNEVIVFIDIKIDNADENLKLNYNVNIEIEE